MAAPQNERALSSRMVTGPSPADSMVISAPKRPLAVWMPVPASRSATAATSGAACSGRAAATNEGLRPLRASPYNVNWLSTRAPPPASTTERFILPSASSNTRSVATLSASQAAWADPSSWVTPTSTSRPAPISPTTSVFTSTRAHATLETTARTGWLLLLGAGALRDDPEGVVDAVHALDRGQHVGEVGDVGQLEGEPKGGDPVAPGGDRGRHDVDVVDPLDQHAPAGRQRARGPDGAVQGEVVGLLLLLAEVGLEAVDHAGGGDLP